MTSDVTSSTAGSRENNGTNVVVMKFVTESFAVKSVGVDALISVVLVVPSGILVTMSVNERPDGVGASNEETMKSGGTL
jgi:hypothetical protein